MNHILPGTTNFNRVRDGRNSPDAYFDFDLTTARDEFINVAGNSFYIDANPADGNAVVYFQETDNLRGPTPFYVSPGFIARIPFTQIRIRNTSQPGKKIRIVYGVDTDFQPGSVSQVSFAGRVDINGATYTNTIGVSGFTAGAATQLIAPGTNLNGIVLSNLGISYLASTQGQGSIIAKAGAAPANLLDGDTIGLIDITPGTVNACNFQLINPLFVTAGKGVYVFVFAGTTFNTNQYASGTYQVI